MSDHPEPKSEETEDVTEESTESEARGFVQYPAPPGQTEYGSYQNPNK